MSPCSEHSAAACGKKVKFQSISNVSWTLSVKSSKLIPNPHSPTNEQFRLLQFDETNIS